MTTSFRIVSLSPNTGSSKRLIFAVNEAGELWKLFIRGDHPLFRDNLLRYRTEVRVPVVTVLSPKDYGGTEDKVEAVVPNWSLMPFCEVEGPVQVKVDTTIKTLWMGDHPTLITAIAEPQQPETNG